MLHYWLDVETQGSQSLLNVADFADPTAYRMQIKQPGSEVQTAQRIDLVETFNWLLGLTVTSQARSGGVLWVEGTNPQGERVLILWRKLTGPDTVDGVAPAGTWAMWWREQAQAQHAACPWMTDTQAHKNTV
jgi:hypothetical protein